MARDVMISPALELLPVRLSIGTAFVAVHDCDCDELENIAVNLHAPLRW